MAVAMVAVACACLTPATAAARPLGIVYHRSLPHAGAAIQGAPAETGPAPAGPPAPSSPPLLSYHGGPVMHSQAVHLIAWTPPGHAFPSGYVSEIETFLTDVAHDSGTYGNVFASDRQYPDGSGAGAYASQFAGTTTETDAIPASGCSAAGGGPCLTDSQLQSLIGGWTSKRGLGDMYVLLLPPGIGVCDDNTQSATCSFKDFCAYHSYAGASGHELVDAIEPYFSPTNPACTTGTSPVGPADATINTVSHEYNEVVTDPLGTSWSDDANGNENGDECAYDFGTATTDPVSGARYNQTINGNHYYLQREWSNADGGCVQTYDRPSFSVTPRLPHAGAPATFDASSSQDSNGDIKTYSWSFGDGTATAPSSSPQASHTYAAGGPYSATLTVTRGDGSSATTATLPLTPSCSPLTVSAHAGTDVAIDPGCSVPDESDQTSAAIVRMPANGLLSWVNPFAGVVDYRSAPGFGGVDQFSLKLRDSGGLDSGPVTETVNVIPAAIGPVPPQPPPTTAPLSRLLTALSLHGHTRRGTGRLSYTLARPGTVTLRLERLVPGVRSGRVCRARTSRRRGGRRCTAALRTHGALKRSLPAGSHSVSVAALAGGRRLGRGSYRIVLRVTGAGGASDTRTIRFSVH